MVCKECGSSNVVPGDDKKGMHQVVCGDCGALVKKMSDSEFADFLKTYIAEAKEKASKEESTKPERPTLPCRHCTDDYYTKHGRLGTVYYKVEAKYCPICGRELQASDRDY